jgi:hypothetical protein
VVLSWPVTTVPFALQSAPNLAGNVSRLPVIHAVTNGTTVSVLVPASASAAFFRLVQAQ